MRRELNIPNLLDLLSYVLILVLVEYAPRVPGVVGKEHLFMLS